MSTVEYFILCLILNTFTYNEAARILAVFPTPSFSHQVVFRPLTQELVKRGHEVVVITTDPAFPKGQAPGNLTEIDVHDISYSLWSQIMSASSNAEQDLAMQIRVIFTVLNGVFEEQLQTKEVQSLIHDKDQHFDLLLLEACVRPALVFSHFYKVPVILVSSLGAVFDNHKTLGSQTHPFLYPSNLHQRLYNLRIWEKVRELYKLYLYNYIYNSLEIPETDMLKRVTGSDVPSLNELSKNVGMLFLNVHPIWEDNRPVPPSVVYMGGLPEHTEKDLPADLKSLLDSSKKGVIYMSFGTNIKPSMLPSEKIQALLNVLSQLPYDVFWKWDENELPGRTENIRIAKWFPQPDLLRHPNIKLFITQGGLQSTDEAIKAGVPLIGIPIFADQWYNTEKYERHQIGIKLDIESLSEENFREAIGRIINDESYRRNVARLRSLMYDQPQQPLERAVWWTEHVLRHGGAKHLRAPAANMGWAEYLELELVFVLLSSIIILMISLVVLFKCLLTVVYNNFICNVKLKKS